LRGAFWVRVSLFPKNKINTTGLAQLAALPWALEILDLIFC
jgi:hypothetical protein